MSVTVANTDAQLSGKTLVTTDANQTIDGLKTYDRGTSAPFAVVSGAAKVVNLDADLLDGQSTADYHNATLLDSGTVAVARGGTGAATLTGVLKGNGTSAITAAAQLAVADGGTGVATQQAYGVLVGGTTATGAMQSIVPGTSGFVLTSAGTGALPTWAVGGTAVDDQNNILATQVFS